MLKQKTLEAFIRWISASPESYHHYDMQRYFELVRIATEQNDLRNLLILPWSSFFNECQPQWNKKFRIKFEMEWKQKISIQSGYHEFLNS